MTNWQEAILATLKGYTAFDIDFRDDRIIVTCENHDSFEVSFHAHGDAYQVGFDSWHEHFDAEEDALNCFAFGLSDECRLKVAKRGKTECSWTVQAWQDYKWVDDTTTCMIFIPFWRSKHIEYRHNVLKA
jgi:hypothetical protein